MCLYHVIAFYFNIKRLQILNKQAFQSAPWKDRKFSSWPPLLSGKVSGCHLPFLLAFL